MAAAAGFLLGVQRLGERARPGKPPQMPAATEATTDTAGTDTPRAVDTAVDAAASAPPTEAAADRPPPSRAVKPAGKYDRFAKFAQKLNG
jgi:hypothetical protein